MRHAQPTRFPDASRHPVSERGPIGMLTRLFRRELDTDVVVHGDDWLKKSGVQQQLEFEGYQLRWVNRDRLDVNFADGWSYATISHYVWWTKRIRRRHGPDDQYLLRRVKSLRGGVGQ